jgi:hypothetical protein
VPEPTASQPVPAPEPATAPNALWARLRDVSIRPSFQEVVVSLPNLSGKLHMGAVLVSRN